ncbi:hypothetical protein EDC18_102192 [Natranaerovirga pectinivora]|uniref:ABC-2 family transporter n=1 Tax=Natranaerovirga pectinivora TaxID=682400 RepID=A0A4R3MQL0_9FIRM|nr:hypothetical protein [Natranaerovirga pectinivora]TCT16176.1 hypothetical protein EDC18_102192 [Natranaerovirga pectinivora]
MVRLVKSHFMYLYKRKILFTIICMYHFIMIGAISIGLFLGDTYDYGLITGFNIVVIMSISSILMFTFTIPARDEPITKFYLNLPLSRKDYILGMYMYLVIHLLIFLLPSILFALIVFFVKDGFSLNLIGLFVLNFCIYIFYVFINCFLFITFKYGQIFLFISFWLSLYTYKYLLDFTQFSSNLIMNRSANILFYVLITAVFTLVMFYLTLFGFSRRDID